MNKCYFEVVTYILKCLDFIVIPCTYLICRLILEMNLTKSKDSYLKIAP